MPKLLFCGRGGCGKSTLVSLLALRLKGVGVLVVDADESNEGLPRMLGLPSPRSLTSWLGGRGALKDQLASGRFPFGELELPSLEGLPGECVSSREGIRLVVVGKVEAAGEGCACPHGALARSFLSSLRGEGWVLVDAEAGLEHFGRGLLRHVDGLVAVVDPSWEGVNLAGRALEMASAEGKPFGCVLNRVDPSSSAPLRDLLSSLGAKVLGELPHLPQLSRASLGGSSLEGFELSPEVEGLLAALSLLSEGFSSPGAGGPRFLPEVFAFRPIGRARVGSREVPRHWTVSDLEGEIELLPFYEPALRELERGRKVVVLFCFDRSRPFEEGDLRQIPPHRGVEMGVFSTCSPVRPNPIGMSVLEVLEVRGSTLRVRGLDMLDGTPILDIKPFAEGRGES